MSADKDRKATQPAAEEAPLPPDPVIEAYKKDVDRTLLRQALELTVTERFEELMELQRFAEALQNSRRVDRDDEFPSSS